MGFGLLIISCCDVSSGVLLFNIWNCVCSLEVSLCSYVKCRMQHRERRSFQDICRNCFVKWSWMSCSQCFWRIAFHDKKCGLLSGIAASWQWSKIKLALKIPFVNCGDMKGGRIKLEIIWIPTYLHLRFTIPVTYCCLAHVIKSWKSCLAIKGGKNISY